MKGEPLGGVGALGGVIKEVALGGGVGGSREEEGGGEGEETAAQSPAAAYTDTSQQILAELARQSKTRTKNTDTEHTHTHTPHCPIRRRAMVSLPERHLHRETRN